LRQFFEALNARQPGINDRGTQTYRKGAPKPIGWIGVPHSAGRQKREKAFQVCTFAYWKAKCPAGAGGEKKLSKNFNPSA